MATKKSAVVGTAAQEYDAKPAGESAADTQAMLKQRLKTFHAGMMDGNVKGGSRMDDVDRKYWPEGEEL